MVRSDIDLDAVCCSVKNELEGNNGGIGRSGKRCVISQVREDGAETREREQWRRQEVTKCWLCSGGRGD